MSDCLEHISLSDFKGYPDIVFTAVKTKSFQKECSEGFVGSIHEYSQTYSSQLSESHLQDIINADSANFDIAGQAFANSEGTCTVAPTPPTKKPILALKAVGDDYFYIGALERYTRTEFESSDPLPDKSSINKNLSYIGSSSVYPYVNQDKMDQSYLAGATPPSVITNISVSEFDASQQGYDSALHTYSVELSPAIDDYDAWLSPSRISFNEGNFFTIPYVNEDRAKNSGSTAAFALSGLGFLLMFSSFAGAGILLIVFFYIIGAFIRIPKARGGFFRSLWLDREGNRTWLQTLPALGDPSVASEYIPVLSDSFYDPVSSKVYVFCSANRVDKNYRQSYNIISYNKTLAGMPSPTITLETSGNAGWVFLKNNITACFDIITNDRCGFLWVNVTKNNESWGRHMLRGANISFPTESVVDLDIIRKGAITRSVQDSTDPNRCYIWVYNPEEKYDRVIEYNATVNGWRVVRKNDSL